MNKRNARDNRVIFS